MAYNDRTHREPNATSADSKPSLVAILAAIAAIVAGTITVLEFLGVKVIPKEEKQFVVVASPPQRVSLQAGPGLQATEIISLTAQTQLTVNGNPEFSPEDGIVWWRVSTPWGDGWVAEQLGAQRLIKPKVQAPIRITSFPTLMEVRGEDCSLKAYIHPGQPDAVVIWQSSDQPAITLNSLIIQAGPVIKCDNPSDPIVAKGRRWWYVDGVSITGKVQNLGWMPDLDETGQQVLLGPQWYFALLEEMSRGP